MGFECVDNNLLGLINELHAFFVKYYSAFISAGKALGALMVVFVVAGEAYKVMVKHQAFDVLAILRPIAFALVLSNWVAFVTAVGAIPRLMENYSKSIFEKEHMSIIHDRETRTKVAEEVLEKTKEAEAAAKVAEQQITDGSTFDKITSMGLDMLETIKEQIASFGTVFQAKANQWLEGWVMKIGELIWQICVYLLFFIKETFAGILIVTGPITFGLSVLSAWKDAWIQWVARYVSVLLYGFIGFFVLAAALQLVKYGVRMDIKILETATSSSEAFWAYSSSSVVTALYHFVCLMVGGIALKFVPELATWIIPSTAGHAAKEFVSGMESKITSAATKSVGLATK